jgi:alkylation response protein AidB-like acyl-CoA dehydrogenase
MTRELLANPLADGARSPWLEVAERAGDELRQSIVEVETEGAVPRAALELLRRYDLLNLVIPAEMGGAGASWSTAAEVTRVLARIDAGLAHALGYHYTWLWFVVLYDTETGREIVRRTARDQLFWASIGSAFGGSGSIRREQAGDPDSAGYIVDAKRGFATGSPLADLLFTQTVSVDDGLLHLTAVDTTLPGVSIADDWDAVGQRLSASNAIVLDAVRVGEADLIAVLPAPGTPPAPLQSLMIPSFQLLFAYLAVGTAEGALLEARDYVLENGRPWQHAHPGVERSADDPHVQSVFGEHAAAVTGAAAQARDAARVLQALFDGDLAITPGTRGQAAELIAAAKVVSHRVGLDATSAIFDATGARSSARRFGLDRFWRNLRTLTLHDPVAYKLTELGDYLLNGTLPVPSVYR